MLKCSCGWKGTNLRPNHARNTADCPGCGMPFEGIPPQDAISTSRAEEEHLVQESTAATMFFTAISARGA